MRKSVFTIDEIKAVIIPIAREYGVRRIALFGSYANGHATPQSDIDLHLIDTIDAWGYFKLCGFQHELEKRFGVSVDILTTGAMDRQVYETVQRNEVLIFEQ